MTAPSPALRSGFPVMPQVPPEQREAHDTSQPAPAPSSGAARVMIRLRTRFSSARRPAEYSRPSGWTPPVSAAIIVG
jgi:hypothetical protein